MGYKIGNTEFTVTGFANEKVNEYQMNIYSDFDNIKILTEYVATKTKVRKNARTGKTYKKPRVYFDSCIRSAITYYEPDGSASVRYSLSAVRDDEKPVLNVTTKNEKYNVNVGTYEYYDI